MNPWEDEEKSTVLGLPLGKRWYFDPPEPGMLVVDAMDVLEYQQAIIDALTDQLHLTEALAASMASR